MPADMGAAVPAKGTQPGERFVGHRWRSDFPEELMHGLLGGEPGKAANADGAFIQAKKSPNGP